MNVYVVHYFNRDIEESEVAAVCSTFDAARAAICDIEQIADFDDTWTINHDEYKMTFTAEEGHAYHITMIDML